MWKNFISDYLSFTKTERTGTIVVLILIGIFITIPFLYPFFIPKTIESNKVFETQIAQLVIKQTDTTKKFAYKNYDNPTSQYASEGYAHNGNAKKVEGELFSFDPNTLDEAGWHRLGVRDKTIATIQKFITKGGKFYQPNDIGKIWGLHEEEIKRLLPFIAIEQKKAAYPQNKSFDNKSFENKTFDRQKYAANTVDINTADTTLLIALPGIGSKLAQRIVIFRDKLGGFYKVDQIGETFGLKDSVFQLLKARFIITSTPLKQLNINTATLEELKVHPYLRYVIANAIVQYRTQHGNFTSIAEIKKIMLVTEAVYNKAAPYLKL